MERKPTEVRNCREYLDYTSAILAMQRRMNPKIGSQWKDDWRIDQDRLEMWFAKKKQVVIRDCQTSAQRTSAMIAVVIRRNRGRDSTLARAVAITIATPVEDR